VKRALVAAVIVTAALSGATAPAASAGWARPFRVSGPTQLDLLAPGVAVSADAAAVAFRTGNAESPGLGSAFVALGPPGGRAASTRRVPSARQILDVAFVGAGLELLTATSSPGQACCTAVEVIRLAGGRFARPQTVVRGLRGAAEGRFVALGDALVAVIATARGVWVTNSRASGRFRATRRLTAGAAQPQTVSAAGLVGGGSIVAWAEALGTDDARRILIATGSKGGSPRHPAAAVTLSGGHRVDELVLASRPQGPSLGWTESWVDGAAHFHSVAVTADVGRRGIRGLSTRGSIASGLSLAADDRGGEIAAWRECSAAGVPCIARAAFRRGGGGFGRTMRLGRIDPSQTPRVAVAPLGHAIVGWISNGDVVAVAHEGLGFGFGRAVTISRTASAANLALAFGPGSDAIAAWTQGTATPSIFGAFYRAR
jgi:hypothetical protein